MKNEFANSKNAVSKLFSVVKSIKKSDEGTSNNLDSSESLTVGSNDTEMLSQQAPFFTSKVEEMSPRLRKSPINSSSTKTDVSDALISLVEPFTRENSGQEQ